MNEVLKLQDYIDMMTVVVRDPVTARDKLTDGPGLLGLAIWTTGTATIGNAADQKTLREHALVIPLIDSITAMINDISTIGDTGDWAIAAAAILMACPKSYGGGGHDDINQGFPIEVGIPPFSPAAMSPTAFAVLTSATSRGTKKTALVNALLDASAAAMARAGDQAYSDRIKGLEQRL